MNHSKENKQEESRGVIYLAFGEQWKLEAKRSLKSLRAVSGLSVAVITDKAWEDGPKPDEFILCENVPGFASKPKYILSESPFDRTLYLDTDTLVVSDPSPIFGLLNYYDIGVKFGGPKLNEPNGLQFHTQCNSGVILFKKNNANQNVMSLWIREYEKARDEQAPAADKRGLGDQRYLAIAIAKSNARPVHLEAYLNFTLFNTLSTCSPPIVLHGRLKDMEIIAEEKAMSWDSAADWNSRIWIPNIRGFLPRGVRRSDPVLALALLLRRFYNDARRAIKRAKS